MTNIDQIKLTGVGADGRECKIPSRIFDRIDAEKHHSMVYFDGAATVVMKKGDLLTAKGTVITNSGRLTVIPDGGNAILSVTPGKSPKPLFELPEDLVGKKDVIDYLCSTRFPRFKIMDDVCVHMLDVTYRVPRQTHQKYIMFEVERMVDLIIKTDSVWRMHELGKTDPSWAVVSEYWDDLTKETCDTRSRRSSQVTNMVAAVFNGTQTVKNHAIWSLAVNDDNDKTAVRRRVATLIDLGAEINNPNSLLGFWVSSYQDKKAASARPNLLDNLLNSISIMIEAGADLQAKMPLYDYADKSIAEYANSLLDADDLRAALKLDAPAAGPKKMKR